MTSRGQKRGFRLLHCRSSVEASLVCIYDPVCFVGDSGGGWYEVEQMDSIVTKGTRFLVVDD